MVITAQQLWRDYDRKQLPLSASEILTREGYGCVEKYVYYNGEAGTDGCTRIFAKLYLPKNAAAAVVVMDDVQNGVESFDPLPFLKKNLAVIVPDYAGETDRHERFTIYPRSLGYANYFRDPACVRAVPESVKRSCRYVWTTVALRSVTLAESLGFAKIAVFGSREGGHQIYKTAIIENAVSCGAVMYSGTIIDEPETPDNVFLSYKAALDNAGYCPHLKAPILIQTPSNEQNSSLDYMSGLYAGAAAGKAFLSIAPRAVDGIEEERIEQTALFFERVFDGVPMPGAPTVKARGSDGSLYIDAAVDSGQEIAAVELFVARAQTVGAYRNWRSQQKEKVGTDEYLSRVEVFSASLPVYAFVNVVYKSGIILSSEVLSVIPAALGVKASPLVQKRLVYDQSGGVTEWVGKELALAPGPFAILGVTSADNRLSTFALADERYKGGPGLSLQLTAYSFIEQSLTFSVTSSRGFTRFECERKLSPGDNWQKLTFSHSDFRSQFGTPDGWNEVIIFEIKGGSKFLINSMLWI
ncbi:MAG: hypothetical protein LBP26_06740 [Clostridiales bacterium]|jgi:hypothetical protein|nr:hypothetical protein [Clostridiales bacterium]